jgi:hypothetical protein
MVETTAWTAAQVFADGNASSDDIPVWQLKIGQLPDEAAIDAAQRAWLASQKFWGMELLANRAARRRF